MKNLHFQDLRSQAYLLHYLKYVLACADTYSELLSLIMAETPEAAVQWQGKGWLRLRATGKSRLCKGKGRAVLTKRLPAL